MVMRHPAQSMPDVIVNCQQSQEEYEAKGYLAPDIDGEFFNDIIVRNELGRQIVAVILGIKDVSDNFRTMAKDIYDLSVKVNDHGQDKIMYDTINYRLIELHGRLEKLEQRDQVNPKPETRKWWQWWK